MDIASERWEKEDTTDGEREEGKRKREREIENTGSARAPPHRGN